MGKKIWISNYLYLSKRKTYYVETKEFELTLKFSNEMFNKHFRTARKDFKEVHAMFASD